MNLSKAFAAFNCRTQSRVGFLVAAEIAVVRRVLGDGAYTSATTYGDLTTELYNAREQKKISAKDFRVLAEILIAANNSIRTERFRFDSAYHKIFEFSKAQNAYVFLQKGTKRDYDELNRLKGKYID